MITGSRFRFEKFLSHILDLHRQDLDIVTHTVTRSPSAAQASMDFDLEELVNVEQT